MSLITENISPIHISNPISYLTDTDYRYQMILFYSSQHINFGLNITLL